ncbi:MAG: LPS export ABC transporter ATP-binding protein [Candidatus Schekmanbacteria bacterium]|nr:LPS export ABC transporter ATP-binding protein [Candidatus Schekmanbacteria bacterium]
MALLQAENLVKIYNKRRVVDNVSIKIASGEVVGLLGPNGAGKTTTFYMIVGLTPPVNGNILLNDEDLTKQAMHERARKGISYLPQEASVFRKLTVEENLSAILQTTDLDRREQKQKLEELLEEFKISHLAQSQAYTLSGGERRRLEIARCLVNTPHFILLDEPLAGIDPKVVNEIQNIIFRLKAKGIGILITDHNVREMLEVTDRAYIINNGQVLVSGTAHELVNDKKAREIYLGEKFRL